VAMALVAAYYCYETVLAYRPLRGWLTVCALLFYGFCMGGGMYNSLRDTPFSDGNTYIARAGRDQFGAESYITATLQLICGTMLAVLIVSTKLLPFVGHLSSRLVGPATAAPSATAPVATPVSTGKGKASSSSSSSSLSSGRAVSHGSDWSLATAVFGLSPWVAASVLFLAWIQLAKIYSIKNPGYNMGMVVQAAWDWM